MENKYSFQEIDNEIRDSFLRTSKVFDERNKLRDNWNSLREYLEKEWYCFDNESVEHEVAKNILDKMNELEGEDND